mmetsp:Transcript_40721/g.110092  ORF Transcript_40721/g.110092 Transcript_40721/m.110092 type:complete len:343 (-) Transcript_40721:61-1089(-)
MAVAALVLALLPVVLVGALRPTPPTALGKVRLPKMPKMQPGCDQGFRPPWHTRCPDAQWVEEMLRVDPSPGKVFMDIGCNKGNDAVAWLEMWNPSPEGTWSTARWIDYYRTNLEVSNYACDPRPPAASAARLQPASRPPGASNVAVCVEPMEKNIRALQRASAALGYDRSTEEHGTLHIVQAAVLGNAHRGQTVDFPDGSGGQEHYGLHLARQPVPVKTVDQIQSELRLPKVDILTVDTEGADPAVLEGATEALKSARYIEFEVHRDLADTVWANTTLRSVVDRLDGQGFDCFWAGDNGRLVNINLCWRPAAELGMWANAACVKRGDPWWDVLQKFASARPL